MPRPPGPNPSSTPPPSPSPSRGRRVPARAVWITLAYALLATLWIAFSDTLLADVFPQTAQFLRWSVFKGILFVAITSGLLFLLMRWAYGALELGYLALREQQREIQRLNRLYVALSQVNQAIVRAATAEALFQEVANALVTHGDFRLAWIGRREPATAQIVPLAHAGDDRGFLHHLVIRDDDSDPVSRTFRSGEPSLCDDLLADPASAPWREAAAASELRAAAVFPIRRQGEVEAVLTVYTRQPGLLSTAETALLAEAAHDVSRALDRFADAESTRALNARIDQEKRFSDAMIESMPGVVYFYNEQRRFVRWNRNLSAVSGYTPEEIARLQPLDLIAPQDRERVAARIEQAFATGECATEALFATKDGRQTPYFFSGRRIDYEGHPFLLGMGIDISERKHAEEEVRRTNETLAGIVASVQQISTRELTPAEAMNVLAARAQELTGADGAVIELIEGDRLVSHAGSGLAAGKHEHPPIAGSLSGVAVRTGQALLCPDTETDERVDREASRRVGARSMIVAPLRERAAIVGVLKVMSARPGAFAPAHVGQLQVLVETFGAVIQSLRAKEQLRASEEQYRLLFVHNPHPMWVWDRETLRFLAVNRAAVRHYGYTEEEFLSRTVLDLRAPDDATTFQSAVANMPPEGPNIGLRRHRRKDGSIIDVEASSDSVVINGRRAWLALAHDITDRLRAERELARTHRALRMLSRCNEALVRASCEDALLQAVCEIAVENGYRLAWVGYAQSDERKSIAVRSHAGHVDDYPALAQLSWDEHAPGGRGPAGQAVRSGEIAVCEDIAADPAFAGWHEAALQRGYRSVTCLPLREGDRTFGVFALYAAEARHFRPDELSLLRELAEDLAFGIVSLRTRSEQRRLQAAVVKVAAGVSAATGTEFFEQLVASMAEAVGAHAAGIARFLPDAPTVARTLAVVHEGRPAANVDYEVTATPCEALLTHDTTVVPEHVPELFPQSPSALFGAQAYVGRRLADSAGRPLGVLFVVFREALAESEFISSTLQIFAARAAAEIERQDRDQQISEQAALLDSAQDAILVRDLAHRIHYWNKSAERLYGWAADEVRGRSARELLYLDPAQFDRTIAHLLARGEWTGELTHRRKDGQTLTIEGHWTLVRDDTGSPKSVLAINTDITERRRLEQQFLRAQRMESIGTLAGGLAHDLNNLLAPIIMGVDLLRQLDARPEHAGILSNMERSARRGAELVKQVLSFARGVEGERIAVRLEEVAREVSAIAKNTFPKDIRVEGDMPPDLWAVRGDPTQLNQVLLNLCVNARDAMPHGGRLGVAARNIAIDEHSAAFHRGAVPGRYVLLEVSDTGCGIPPELVDRIFEPFFTTKEVGKGTGLGLSTVLGIVRSHGGLINVYSEPGKGSVFKVYLPAQPADDAAAALTATPAVALPRGHGELILVVDDETAILDVTRRTLEAFGYRVLTAENGAQAIALFAARPHEIAVVLTDIMMPVMDGPALIVALRRIDPQVRIIAASGLKANDGVTRIPNAEVSQFLPKPYSAEAMLRTVGRMLSSGSRAPFPPDAPTP